MIRVVYVSFATVPFDEPALDALLKKSRDNNRRDGITGMLLYRDGDFLQILEGEEESVRGAYRRIGRDSRHGRILMLDESDIAQREFGDWSMGFRRLRRDDMPEGFVDFFDRRFDAAAIVDRRGEALQFLSSFRALSH